MQENPFKELQDWLGETLVLYGGEKKKETARKGRQVSLGQDTCQENLLDPQEQGTSRFGETVKHDGQRREKQKKRDITRT